MKRLTPSAVSTMMAVVVCALVTAYVAKNGLALYARLAPRDAAALQRVVRTRAQEKRAVPATVATAEPRTDLPKSGMGTTPRSFDAAASQAPGANGGPVAPRAGGADLPSAERVTVDKVPAAQPTGRTFTAESYKGSQRSTHVFSSTRSGLPADQSPVDQEGAAVE